MAQQPSAPSAPNSQTLAPSFERKPWHYYTRSENPIFQPYDDAYSILNTLLRTLKPPSAAATTTTTTTTTAPSPPTHTTLLLDIFDILRLLQKWSIQCTLLFHQLHVQSRDPNSRPFEECCDIVALVEVLTKDTLKIQKKLERALDSMRDPSVYLKDAVSIVRGVASQLKEDVRPLVGLEERTNGR